MHKNGHGHEANDYIGALRSMVAIIYKKARK